jgi:hypothetical protein
MDLDTSEGKDSGIGGTWGELRKNSGKIERNS